MGGGEKGKIVKNKQIIFKGYIERAPQENDMELKISSINLENSGGGVMVKNMYLSCDPYMRGRMRDFHASYIPPYQPSSVGTATHFILYSLFNFSACF